MMGGDLLHSSKPRAPRRFTDRSLSRKGVSFARVTTFLQWPSCPAPRHQVRPVKGVPTTTRSTAPSSLNPRSVAGAPQGSDAVSIRRCSTLNARVGDTLRLGFGTFTIIATVRMRRARRE